MACLCCRIVELNTLNGVKNACMSFPVQNAWKAGASLAVHGVVYNPADGKLKVRKRERESFFLALRCYQRACRPGECAWDTALAAIPLAVSSVKVMLCAAACGLLSQSVS